MYRIYRVYRVKKSMRVLFTVLMLGCISSYAELQGQSRPKITPCAVLKTAEVEKATGQDKLENTLEGNSCDWRAAIRQGNALTVVLTLHNAGDKDQFARLKREMSEAGSRMKAVSGLGDEANYQGDYQIAGAGGLLVRRGTQMFTIFGTIGSENSYVTLAKIVLQRI